MWMVVAAFVQLTSSLTAQVVDETACVGKMSSSAFDPSSELLYRTLYSLFCICEELLSKLTDQFT